MRDSIKLSVFFLVITLSVMTLFAQSGDNAENQPKPEANQTEPSKIHESLTLNYEVSPVPMKYLFTSKTELNAKIENLTDEKENKDVVGTMTSSTTLLLTSEDLSVEEYKIKVAFEKLSGSYDIDGKTVEFNLSKDGLDTKVDGKEGETIPELSDWNAANPESLGKILAEFNLTKDGKIKNAVSHTSAGEQAGMSSPDAFNKSLIYLQNPMTLINLLFWELPADELKFERTGNIPAKPAPSWKSKINYPFESAFVFETVDSECSIVSVTEEKEAESTETPDADAAKKPIHKIIRIHRIIKHPTEKDTQIIAYMDFDTVKRVPILVTFDIYRTTELNPTEDRKITLTQKTNFRFVLQK